MSEEWLWGGGDEEPKPTEHIVFYIDGQLVSEITFLKDNAGGFATFDLELPPGKHRFGFASLTAAQLYDEMGGQ